MLVGKAWSVIFHTGESDVIYIIVIEERFEEVMIVKGDRVGSLSRVELPLYGLSKKMTLFFALGRSEKKMKGRRSRRDEMRHSSFKFISKRDDDDDDDCNGLVDVACVCLSEGLGSCKRRKRNFMCWKYGDE
ncbi:hypothetical protein RUM44_010394 [Polyplax serrata]|uniref:Uncharacterized protein n=1 Tax=Polyplax serrata TaxID=468196 RepID=A0ABR1AVE6_POLSC